ncbi:iron ABC transporter permease [Hoeflea sp.]|uniref:ABC transporter permease n=1 Tax=Hoeflea sp. TaxID=1940281 RepID=UPI0025C69408|nr:iron ABC transporter permease [Hoeflea sp.]MBU4531469.1 iron ABC transporter permease [Alphaproteobacteria bacterium]MBU4544326.1 iron ABC transporter permease [Alphaproteobacteria bacterium]MBU4550437.1 iron ABC transporter permease [Alphaproteobacteria bacterium]
MKAFEGRIGLIWSGLLLASVLALPWFKGGAIGASALAEGVAGRAWLLPLVAVAVALTALTFLTRNWRVHQAAAALVGAGLAWLILQGFGIGLRGPALPGIELLFPAAAAGQPGFGWGAWLAGVALIGALAEVLAARGFCRGERFAAFSIVGIVAALTLFVFFPILKLMSAAFIAPDGTLSALPFLARITAADLWSVGCLTGAGRCGVVINSVVLGVLSAAFATALGLALALLVARTDFRMKRALRAISILPIITPPFVVGVAIIVLFGRTGVVTVEVAEWFGVRPSRWVYGLPGILMAQVLAFAPVTFLVILSALEAINPTLEEASTTLGARPVTTFRTVTWPLLRPALAAAFLLAFIESLADFGNAIVLGGSYDVLSTKIFFAVVGAQYDLGQAATLSVLLLALTVAAFWVQTRWLGRASYVTVTGKSDAGLVAPMPLLIKWAAVAAVLPFVIFTAGVYMIVLIGGFVTDIARLEMSPTFGHIWTAFSFEVGDRGLQLFGSAWDSMITTLWVSALSAPLTMGIGILTAWLIARQDFAGKRAFEFGTLLSFAIPGTVVGVSYIAAFNVPPIDMTGTLWILVICFVFRNLPVGMRAGIAALAQIDRSMEEASQTMGAGGGRVLADVVLPLIRPAIFTALVYSFVTAMTAVSAVIFLVSARHNMATAYIMGRVENGEYALAIAYSTVLMLVMVVCVALMNLAVGRRKLGRRTAVTGTAQPAQ